MLDIRFRCQQCRPAGAHPERVQGPRAAASGQQVRSHVPKGGGAVAGAVIGAVAVRHSVRPGQGRERGCCAHLAVAVAVWQVVVVELSLHDS